jgi:hypothetical protein
MMKNLDFLITESKKEDRRLEEEARKLLKDGEDPKEVLVIVSQFGKRSVMRQDQLGITIEDV